jgi:hypothetical protein
MKLKKLRKKLRKQLRKETKLANRIRIEEVLGSEEGLRMLNERIEAEVNPWNSQGLIRGDRERWSFSEWWANVWDWFVANWPKILEIIITIAPLLLLEPKRENS